MKRLVIRILLLPVLFSCYQDLISQSELDYIKSTGLILSEKMGSIEDNVNFFTGDFQVAINLFSGEGVNYPINLIYNSNIDVVAHAGNQTKQASWLGMGWEIEIPYINTILTDDFNLEFVQGRFSNSMIYDEVSETYKLKDFKFWKISDIRLDNSLIGWEIISESGLKMKFLNNNKRYFPRRNYVLSSCSSDGCMVLGVIENGFWVPSYWDFGYRWDLSEVEDIYGNKITFEYEQVLEYLTDKMLYSTSSVATLSNYTMYTQASYIKKIENHTTNKVIYFEREPRLDFEDISDGPYDFVDDPINNESDGIIEFYTKERLKNVKVYSQDGDPPSAGDLIFQWEFGYDYLNNGTDDKLTLTSIQQLDPNDINNKLPGYAFEYQEFPINGFNKGALNFIIYPEGGSQTIVYEECDGTTDAYRVDYVAANDGMGNSYTTEYTWSTSIPYSNGTFYGHDNVEVEQNPGTNGKTKYYHEIVDANGLLGLLESTQIFPEGSPDALYIITNSWGSVDMGDDSFFRTLDSRTSIYNGTSPLYLNGIFESTGYTYNTGSDGNGLLSYITEPFIGRVTEFKYAYQQTKYRGTSGGGANGTLGMDDLHILSAVAQQTTYAAPDVASISNTNAVLSSAVTYKQWPVSSGKWAPESNYSWLENDPTVMLPDFNFNTPPGNDDWIENSSVLDIDAFGNVLEVQDALGTVISTKLGNNSSRPVATFVNASTSQNVLGNESGYVGFESNDETDGIADNDYWLFDARNNFSSDAYAGLYSRKVEAISGPDKYGPTRDFQPPTSGQDRIYIASCWVKTMAGSNQVSLVFQDKTGTSNNSVNFLETSYAAGTGDWEYLEGEIDMSQTTAEKLRVFIVNESSTHVLVDEIRVHPRDAICSSQSYDEFGAVITSVDANSIRTQLEYDEFNRPVKVKNTDDDLLAQTAYYLTTDFNVAPNNVTNNAYTGTQTLTSVSYSDGLGRAIQSQVQDGTQRIIQQNVYDDAGRMRVATKPAYVSGSLAFDSSFLPSSWTIGSQMTSGNLQTYYSISGAGPDAGGYPFAQVDLKADPLGRPDKAGSPGTSYRIGSGNETEILFGKNVAADVPGYAANQLYKTTLTDEENKIVEIFRDRNGNTICVKAPENATTYYEYDILGNLLKVTPPLSSAGSHISEFQYNTLGQLIAKVTPDLDGDYDNDPTEETLSNPDVQYKYDSNGNLRFVQDPVRNSGGRDLFFYKYDALDRPTTMGVATADADIPLWADLDPDVIYDGGTGENFENESLHEDYLRQKNVYDTEPTYGSGIWTDATDPGDLNYLKDRLVANAYYDRATGKWGYTYYSYDKFGNLEQMIQDLPGTELGIKTIDYAYDRLGRQTVKTYQSGESDAFYYWYDYDAAGRLYKVFANKTDDKPTAKTVSEYTYWPTGQVKSMTYANGHTIDYTFNERDWLDALDMPNVFELDLDFDKVGNIDYMSQKIDSDRNGSLTNNSDYGYNFGYDNLYRLLSASNTNGVQTDAGYKYDLNGNILGLNRGSSGIPATTYNYYNGGSSNRLEYVTPDQSSGNYVYDYNGSLLRDVKKGITTDIANDYRNLPYRIWINTNKFDMSYDAAGSRVIKKFVAQ